MSLSVSTRVTGGWSADSGVLTATSRLSRQLTLGDEIDPGTADQLYLLDFSLAAAASVSVDMKGGGGEEDVLKDALNLSTVRWLYVEITSPATGKSVHVGPLGETDAWQGPFGGVTATDRLQVQDTFYLPAPIDGWSVGASTKVLTITNPSAVTVAGVLIIAGE